MLIAKESKGKDFDPIPEGLHLAICYAIYDLGTQENIGFSSSSQKILIIWELPDEQIEITKDNETKILPRSISKKFTLSLGKKSNLRPFLESWRGKKFTDEELLGFDVTEVLGKPCQLNVVHDESTDGKHYAGISTVVPAPKGLQNSVLYNPLTIFNMGDKISDQCPEWIQKIIKKSPEFTLYEKLTQEEKEKNDDVDINQLPF